MWTAQTILDTLNSHSAELHKMGAMRLGLFGSYRRAEATTDSDMDFLVRLARPTFDDYMDIKIFLEDTFNCKVDLVLEDTIKPRLRASILGEASMPREYKSYLEDILKAYRQIQDYTHTLSCEAFSADQKVVDAVLYNLFIVGEAVKHLPEQVRTAHPEVEWRRITGVRDIVAHEYFGVDLNIIWDVVIHKLPEQLIPSVLALLDDEAE